MTILQNLEKLQSINHLAISKQNYTKESLSQLLVTNSIEDAGTHWLIPCNHLFHAPATSQQLDELVAYLDFGLPDQLRSLLEWINGAELFRIGYKGGELGSYWIARYNILDCSMLTQIYQEMLAVFLTFAENDPAYASIDQLNYLAFCDIGDGNYLALSLDGANKGSIFYLDHDYSFYPYGTQFTKEAYAPVAESLDHWLEQLIVSYGSQGMGDKFIPL